MAIIERGYVGATDLSANIGKFQVTLGADRNKAVSSWQIMITCTCNSLYYIRIAGYLTVSIPATVCTRMAAATHSIDRVVIQYTSANCIAINH